MFFLVNSTILSSKSLLTLLSAHVQKIGRDKPIKAKTHLAHPMLKDVVEFLISKAFVLVRCCKTGFQSAL